MIDLSPLASGIAWPVVVNGGFDPGARVYLYNGRGIALLGGGTFGHTFKERPIRSVARSIRLMRQNFSPRVQMKVQGVKKDGLVL